MHVVYLYTPLITMLTGVLNVKRFFAIPAQPELASHMLTLGSYLITKTITLDTEIVIF